MRSFRTKISERRSAFLTLAGQIEGQLRLAYDKKFRSGLATQSSLATSLGVNRSAIHRRLTGRANMTIETIADMVWALGYAIKIVIYDPKENLDNSNIFQNSASPGSVRQPPLGLKEDSAGSSGILLDRSALSQTV